MYWSACTAVCSSKTQCLLQSRFHAPTAADAWLMQPIPAAGLEASQVIVTVVQLRTYAAAAPSFWF